MRRILTLKDVGFSLSEIQEILTDESRYEPLLKESEQALSRAMLESRARLERVRGYLAQLDAGEIMQEDITVTSLPEVTVASMRTTVPNYDAFFEIVPKMGEHMTSVGAVCRVPEYCFTIFHNNEYREEDIEQPAEALNRAGARP